MELYVDDPDFMVGTKPAGLYAVCQWIIEKYPEDIFVKEPAQLILMRQNAKEILAMRK